MKEDTFNFDDWINAVAKLRAEIERRPFVCWRKREDLFPEYWQPVNFLESDKIGKFEISLN